MSFTLEQFKEAAVVLKEFIDIGKVTITEDSFVLQMDVDFWIKAYYSKGEVLFFISEKTGFYKGQAYSAIDFTSNVFGFIQIIDKSWVPAAFRNV